MSSLLLTVFTVHLHIPLCSCLVLLWHLHKLLYSKWKNWLKEEEYMKWAKRFSRYTSDGELSSRLHKEVIFFNCKKSKKLSEPWSNEVNGIFSEEEIWLTGDHRKMPMVTSLKMQTVTNLIFRLTAERMSVIKKIVATDIEDIDKRECQTLLKEM